MESQPVSPESFEAKGAAGYELPKAPELSSPETRVESAESLTRPVVNEPAGQLPVVPVPARSSGSKDVDPAIVNMSGSNPSVATDDGLIEKQWVDRAKQVVRETRSDPYMQEVQFSMLQADYLKKRHGKDVKLSDA